MVAEQPLRRPGDGHPGRPASQQGSQAMTRYLTSRMFGVLIGFMALFCGSAWAHKPSDSYLTMRAAEGSSAIAVRWDIALRDLDYVLQLDRNGNGEISWGEVRTRADDITQLATSHLKVNASGQGCLWST